MTKGTLEKANELQEQLEALEEIEQMIEKSHDNILSEIKFFGSKGISRDMYEAAFTEDGSRKVTLRVKELLLKLIKEERRIAQEQFELL